MAANDKEYAETIANMLIEQLERGTAPWQKPWSGGEKFMPHNPISGKSYKGSNALYLMAVQEQKGYSDNRWLTYKQAEGVGGQVRKGEKSTKVRFWQWTTERDKTDDNGNPVLGPDGKPEKETVRLDRPWVRQFAVFNADQIDGMPPREKRPQISKVETVERAEKILANSGAKIRHIAGDRACYNSGTDTITLPEKEQFSDTYNYYSTALHELGHWTGHPSRLDRELGNAFGTEKYAKEELRAEIASMMLADEIGVENDPQHVEQHAAYVGSWVKVLKDDPTEILRAASDATKMTRYVMGLENQQEQEIQQEQNEQQGHYSDRTIQALIDRHGWTPTDPDRPLDNVGKMYEGVGPDAMIAPNGERRLIAGYSADRERRRYVAVTLGDKTIADFDGREAAPEEIAARLDLAAATFADEQREKRGHEAKYVVEATAGRGETMTESAAALPNISDEPTLLETQFKDRAAVKELGARWDKEVKKWFVPAGQDLTPFAAWLPTKTDTVADESAHEQAAEKLDAEVGLDSAEQSQSPTLATEKTFLSVPYRDKNEAKSLGARWDKEAKSWYAPVGADLNKFEKFMPKPVAAAVDLAGTAQEQFGQALKDAGLQLDGDPVMDGKIHRVKADGDKGRERSGAYCGYLDGRPGGWFQNYKTGEKQNWKADVSVKLSDEERASMLALAAQEKAGRELERAFIQDEAAIAARELVATLTPAQSDNAYLVRKGITSEGLLQATEATVAKANEHYGEGNHSFEAGDLVVPMRNMKEIRSVQIIKPNGWKGFMPNGQVSGTYNLLGRVESKIGSGEDKPVWIAEGLATAKSIHEATGEPVVVAFNASNLRAVAEVVRDEFPLKEIRVAGDDDRHLPLKEKPQPNIGVIKAQEAADAVNGLAVLPTFGAELDGVDWNDIAQKEGLDGLARELNETVSEAQMAQDRERKQAGQALSSEVEKTEEREDALSDAISAFRNLNEGIDPQKLGVKAEQSAPVPVPEVAQAQQVKAEPAPVQKAQEKMQTRPGLRVGGRR